MISQLRILYTCTTRKIYYNENNF